MNSKNIMRIVVVSLLALGATACGKDKDENNQSSENGENTPKVEILDSRELSYEEMVNGMFDSEIYGEDPEGNNGDEENVFADMMAQIKDGFKDDVADALEEEGGSNGLFWDDYTSEVLTIKYTTVDALGNPLELSGTLSVGKINGKYMKVKNLMLHTHPTAFDEDMLDMVDFSCRTADGLAVLAPHYEGFGITAARKQTYLCQKLIGRQCADMIPAAIEVLNSLGIEVADDMGTYIVGYSQGGGNALATARYLQEEAPAALRTMANVKKVNAGAGPYDPYATFQHWLATDKVSMSVVLPMVISGLMQGHPDIMAGIKLTDYFSEQYLSTGIVQAIENNTVNQLGLGAVAVDGKDELKSINLGGSGIMMYWMRFSGIMSDEVKDENSHIRNALEEALKAEVVTDWTPQFPVEFFTSETDNVIPVEANARATYNKFLAAGANVTLEENSLASDHILAQMAWMLRINVQKAYK